MPSLTELLFELGAGARMAGASDYCLHPAPELARLPRVGGQKDPDLAQLLALAPDLVVVAKEENLKRDVERLEAAGVPVYATDVKTVGDALRLPAELGEALGLAPELPRALHDRMAAGVEAARQAAPAPPLNVVCFVWRDPWIAAGGDTYLSDVLAACGARNLLAQRTRYPKLDLGAARALRPDVVGAAVGAVSVHRGRFAVGAERPAGGRDGARAGTARAPRASPSWRRSCPSGALW